MPLEPGLWEVHDSVANKQMLMLFDKCRKEYGGVYFEGQVQEMEMRCLFGGLGKFTMGAHGPTHPESFVIPLSSTSQNQRPTSGFPSAVLFFRSNPRARYTNQTGQFCILDVNSKVGRLSRYHLFQVRSFFAKNFALSCM